MEADRGHAAQRAPPSVQQVERKEVSGEIYRSSRVRKLSQELVDPRLSAKRKRNIDEIDLPGLGRCDDVAQRTGALTERLRDRMAAIVGAVVVVPVDFESERRDRLHLKGELFP